MTRAQSSALRPSRAFSLIEILMVIAVIGIIAGMVLGVMPAVTGKRRLSSANAQMQNIVTAIESYKAERGYYPPTPTRNVGALPFATNTLLYELVGTRVVDNTPTYLCERTGERLRGAELQSLFGVGGVLNSGSSEAPEKNYIKGLRTSAYVAIPGGASLLAVTGPERIPWSYDAATTNRNNPDGFDLWAEIKIGNQKHKIKNWKSQ